MAIDNPFVGLALRCPAFSIDDAAALAREHFGIDGTVRELGSNQDRNYRIEASAGRFVLKIANPGWERVSLEAQNAAMQHLAARVTFAVPVPRAALSGQSIVSVERDGVSYDVRLVTFVEGIPLQDVAYRSPTALRRHGQIAADAVEGLADFAHAGLERTIQWDLRHAALVISALAPQVADAARRSQAADLIAQSERLLEPIRSLLPIQPSHADCTDYNVMATRDEAGRMMPSGLIDFGDLVSTYRISDIATAVQSLALERPEAALEMAVEVVRGFAAVLPLSEPEIEAIWPLILARTAVCAVCDEQQATMEPENAYAQKAVGDGWTVADGLKGIPAELAHETLRAALGFGPSARCVAFAAKVTQVAANASPMLPCGLGEQLDLSVHSELLREGVWLDASATRGAISGTEGTIGRYGEGRLIHARPELRDAPPSVHLGLDLLAPAGTVVTCPLPARAASIGESSILLELDAFSLRLTGVVPSVRVGDRPGSGEALGVIADVPASSPLPAHLHLQVVPAGIDAPGLATPARAAGWLALCPDPSPLVGQACAAPVDDRNGLFERRDRHFATVQEHYFAAPPQIERGWKHHLVDTSGRAYLDMVNNVAVLGHSHPAVEAAVSKQLSMLNTNSRFHYRIVVELCERLAALAPVGLDSVFLVGSGSEANDTALRLIRCATGQKDTIVVQSAYHGWTVATDELSTALYDNPRSAEKRPAWIHPLESPNVYRGRHRGSDAGPLYAQDVDRVVGALAERGDGVAGFIAESPYGNAGGVVLPDGYLRDVYAKVRAAGGLCIADEVQVGYGRLGQYFWGFEQQGVVPDVITIAKATGNGFPVGAVITTRAIAEAFWHEGAFFSSTGGSPASCAAAMAVLDVIESEGLQENAHRVGAHLRSRLEALCAKHPICGAVHGLGLYLGLELIRDTQTLEEAGPEASAICEQMRELGVIIQPTSDGMNVLKIKPPLCLTVESADYFVDTLDDVLTTGW